MTRDDNQLLETLLDWHLGQLDDQEREAFEQEMARNDGLRRRSGQLGRLLQPLDHWSGSQAPSTLVDKVLAHVKREGRALRTSAPMTADPVDGEAVLSPPGGRRIAPFLAAREWLAVAACIALLVGVLGPGLSSLRNRAKRTQCATNLAAIYRGVGVYRADYAGSLPFAGFARNASWLPSENDSRPFASNSRHMYLLIKCESGPQMSDFICPSCGDARTPSLALNPNADDFPRGCEVSYASLNLSGRNPNIRPVKTVAYASDVNPLFVNARFDSSLDPDRTNSPSHGGKGQTVLSLDGQVEWLTSPLRGERKDNLWLAGDIRQYDGTESTVSKDDTQLVPGFPVFGTGVRN